MRQANGREVGNASVLSLLVPVKVLSYAANMQFSTEDSILNRSTTHTEKLCWSTKQASLVNKHAVLLELSAEFRVRDLLIRSEKAWSRDW